MLCVTNASEQLARHDERSADSPMLRAAHGATGERASAHAAPSGRNRAGILRRQASRRTHWSSIVVGRTCYLGQVCI